MWLAKIDLLEILESFVHLIMIFHFSSVIIITNFFHTHVTMKIANEIKILGFYSRIFLLVILKDRYDKEFHILYWILDI
jgi:hypothetical protein